MPQAGSNTRLRNAAVALMLVAVFAIGAWVLLHNRATRQFSTPTGIARQDKIASVEERRAGSERERLDAKARAPTARSSGSTPLPSAGTPLASIYDELKARADAGDADAATRLFHEVHRCVALRQKRRLLAEFHSMIADNPDVSSIGLVHDGQPPHILMLREMTDYIQANGARCAGATDAQLASFTPLQLRAAQLGDLKALDCYVGTDFDGMQGLLDHPEWLDQYRTQAPGLVESALQRGDWVVVDLLHHAYGGAFGTSARGQLFGIDPVMDYRLLRLEQLGATGAFADKLAPMVAGAAKALSPAQVADADAWAGDYYSRYFNSASNEVSNGANICDITDD